MYRRNWIQGAGMFNGKAHRNNALSLTWNALYTYRFRMIPDLTWTLNNTLRRSVVYKHGLGYDLCTTNHSAFWLNFRALVISNVSNMRKLVYKSECFILKYSEFSESVIINFILLLCVLCATIFLKSLALGSRVIASRSVF